MNESITNNQSLSRFEFIKNGYTAYADYHLTKDILAIRFVFAPEELRGSGVAGELMAGIVDYAYAQNLKIIPICGYAAAWLRKNPQHTHLMT